ncbi:hypothetical protein ACWCRD_01620 [Streptomyces sp. NPDC002092]
MPHASRAFWHDTTVTPSGAVLDSVEHGRTLEHYRAAHEIDTLSVSHKATTEQLRSAMVHYRALFDELLSDGGQPRQAPA